MNSIHAYLFASSIILLFPQSALAVLVDGSILEFTPAPGSPNTSQPATGAGSWFTVAPASFSTYVSLESLNGIIIGSSQPASGRRRPTGQFEQ